MRMDDLKKFDIPADFGKEFTILDLDFIRHRMLNQLTPSDRELLKRHFHVGGGAGGTSTASSTSGAVSVNPVPVVGESWWVKLPNQDRLELVRIGGISNASVAIIVPNQRIGGLRDGRYERSYFKFVEKNVG